MQTHEKHDNLFQDEDMLEYSPDVKHISAPLGCEVAEHHQRVLAKYDKGDWRTEAQIQIEGEWYVATRNRLSTPPSGEDEYTATGREVKKNLGMFTGFSIWMRVLLAPVYATAFAYYCVKDIDVNLQILESEE